jgi:hypothetical protein
MDPAALATDASLPSEYVVAERIVRNCLRWRVARRAKAKEEKYEQAGERRHRDGSADVADNRGLAGALRVALWAQPDMLAARQNNSTASEIDHVVPWCLVWTDGPTTFPALIGHIPVIGGDVRESERSA